MKSSSLLLVRGIIFMAGAILLISSIQTAISIATSHGSLSQLIHLHFDDAVHINTLIAGNLNQLLAVLFTAVAIAVALTGAQYSIKFLDFFIRDPINTAALGLVVFAGINNTWLGFTLKNDFVPEFQIFVSLILDIVCFSFIFPYLYYVFRFLHPNSVIAKLEQEAAEAIGSPSRSRVEDQHKFAAAIEHIANICIRSVDRDDRNTALWGIQAIERVALRYWTAVKELDAAWFEADPALFLGFPVEAIDELSANRSWVEMKLLSQYLQILAATGRKMPDLVSAVATSTHDLAVRDTCRESAPLRRLMVEYFNTYLRLALNNRDARSVFTILEQYRLFAEDISAAQPDDAVEIATYFRYYATVARDMGMAFLIEVMAHDLGRLVWATWQTSPAARDALLDELKGFDSITAEPLPGVKKAQAILAANFLAAGEPEPAAALAATFASLAPASVAQVRDELMAVTRRDYWEVNERRMNIHYVPEPQREKLREFLDSIVEAKTLVAAGSR